MLRRELVNLVNSGGVWAFVGSGPSVDSGHPTWAGLLDAVLVECDEQLRNEVASDQRFMAAKRKHDYPSCFWRLEKHLSRAAIEASVRRLLSISMEPSHLVAEITDWPFSGYITTNYDHLLEMALRQHDQHGWIPVGNTDEEIPKVGGAASELVWHIHGSVQTDTPPSKLVLSSGDYENLYLEDGPLIRQLRGLLGHRRIVFIGFGFRDKEVVRLIKRVGKLSDPTRPIFAFLSEMVGSEHESERQDLLESYNVDVIPYEVHGGSHAQLLDLLKVYGSLVVRRTLRRGHVTKPCPSYDPEVTGLLLYNELCLRRGVELDAGALEALLKARLLASITGSSAETERELVSATLASVETLRTGEDTAYLTARLSEVTESLIGDGLVKRETSPMGVTRLQLTSEGINLVRGQAAHSEVLGTQFSASLGSRAEGLLPSNQNSARMVAEAAETFLKDCVKKRSLGVAQAQSAVTPEQRSWHMVALLQSLPDYMQQLAGHDDMVALSRLVQDVLASPSTIERKYIGLTLQAQFGIHIIGYDPSSFDARAREFSETIFLLDSSTLITYLAKGCQGYASASLLLDRIKSASAEVATTPLLVEEVTEHAAWALRNVDSTTGALNINSLMALTGRSGMRVNAFLDGFSLELAGGTIVPDFREYLRISLGSRIEGGRIDRYAVMKHISSIGIAACILDQCEGFRDELYADRDECQEKIAALRTFRGNFKHDRQVKAEAEALLLIREVRTGRLKIGKGDARNAYFLSFSRVIDDVAGGGLPVTMRPEYALQWASTVQPCPEDELAALTNGLLWELAERDLALVDSSTLHVAFAPLLSAARDDLATETERHRILVAERFGEPRTAAFNETGELDTPVVVEGLRAQRLALLEEELERERGRRAAAEARVSLTKQEREELDELRRLLRVREMLRGQGRQRRAKKKK